MANKYFKKSWRRNFRSRCSNLIQPRGKEWIRIINKKNHPYSTETSGPGSATLLQTKLKKSLINTSSSHWWIFSFLLMICIYVLWTKSDSIIIFWIGNRSFLFLLFSMTLICLIILYIICTYNHVKLLSPDSYKL